MAASSISAVPPAKLRRVFVCGVGMTKFEVLRKAECDVPCSRGPVPILYVRDRHRAAFAEARAPSRCGLPRPGKRGWHCRPGRRTDRVQCRGASRRGLRLRYFGRRGRGSLLIHFVSCNKATPRVGNAPHTHLGSRESRFTTSTTTARRVRLRFSLRSSSSRAVCAVVVADVGGSLGPAVVQAALTACWRSGSRRWSVARWAQRWLFCAVQDVSLESSRLPLRSFF